VHATINEEEESRGSHLSGRMLIVIVQMLTLRLSIPLSTLDKMYSCIDVYRRSEPDICRRIEKARSCMKSLDRNI